jgi:hypothetical protein
MAGDCLVGWMCDTGCHHTLVDGLTQMRGAQAHTHWAATVQSDQGCRGRKVCQTHKGRHEQSRQGALTSLEASRGSGLLSGTNTWNPKKHYHHKARLCFWRPAHTAVAHACTHAATAQTHTEGCPSGACCRPTSTTATTTCTPACPHRAAAAAVENTTAAVAAHTNSHTHTLACPRAPPLLQLPQRHCKHIPRAPAMQSTPRA